MHKIFPETLVYLEIISNFALAIEKNGSLAQLNRASDYGSEGYRFESYASHFFKFVSSNLQNGSLAQLNRASDYGSEGYRFESYASHSSNLRVLIYNGSLAQLNRASDYGSEGYRFESYASHFFKLRILIYNGSLAQLNRASDYGSEGYRFESYASHISGDYLMVFAFFMPAYFSFLDGASETDIDQYPVLCVVLSHKMDDKAVLVSL